MLTEGKKVCKDCGEVKCKCLDEGKGSKPDFLDMDKDGDKKEPMKKAAKDKSKGAIAEAVARVEQQLAEKYMGFKKTAAAVAKGGSAKDPEAVAASIGRKKYGKEKFQKAAAAGKKLGEGEYNEDMLSPGQKKIAKMSPPPDKIDGNDLAALRAGKKKKQEGNAFSGAVAKAKASGADEFKVGDKEYKVQEGGEYKGDKPGQSNFKPYSGSSSTPDKERDAMYKKDNIPPELQANNSPAYQNWRRDRDEAIRQKSSQGNKMQEGFPTVADAQKRHKEQTGKTTHGTKTKTSTGTRHERNYDHDDEGVDRATGEKRGRGRPKADRFK